MFRIENWCDEVVKEVRFHPDHKAIRKELTDHYEDRSAGLRQAGGVEFLHGNGECHPLPACPGSIDGHHSCGKSHLTLFTAVGNMIAIEHRCEREEYLKKARREGQSPAVSCPVPMLGNVRPGAGGVMPSVLAAILAF